MNIKNIRSLISQFLSMTAIFLTGAAIVMLLAGTITRELRLDIASTNTLHSTELCT